jgi:hypothetical protein
MYDLKTDPLEMTNLYNDERYSSLKAKLEKRLEELKHEYNYTVPDYPFE